MTKFLSLALLSFSLTACGGADPETACKDYIAAANGCFSEAAEGTAPADVPDTFCDAYSDLSGTAASDAADLMNCYADVWTEADCTTSEGLTAASTEYTGCATAR